MDIKNEINAYNVSRETFEKISAFVALLTEWNNKMNLVSKNAIAEIWPRHVLDSMQLINYIPQNIKTLVDIGSGSGFPGIVLAILLQEFQPQAKVILVESIAKKTVYLKDVCDKLGLNNVEVLNSRVENAVFKNVSVITARAVAALDILCGYASKIGNPETEVLLLKGKTYRQEDIEAQKKWRYTLEVYPNKYSTDGVVLKLSNLRNKK